MNFVTNCRCEVAKLQDIDVRRYGGTCMVLPGNSVQQIFFFFRIVFHYPDKDVLFFHFFKTTHIVNTCNYQVFGQAKWFADMEIFL